MFLSRPGAAMTLWFWLSAGLLTVFNGRERSFSRGWKIWLEGYRPALKASRFDLPPKMPATTSPFGKAAWQAYLLTYAATVLRSSEKVDCRTSVVSSFGVPSTTLATILSTSLYVVRP